MESQPEKPKASIFWIQGLAILSKRLVQFRDIEGRSLLTLSSLLCISCKNNIDSDSDHRALVAELLESMGLECF